MDPFFLELNQPLVFPPSGITGGVTQALDQFDPADPHRRADEFDDPPSQTAPRVNQQLYDTSTITPEVDTNTSLEDFPDYSDEVMSEYKFKQMLGIAAPVMPMVADLDTAPNYVGLIKATARGIYESENEFDVEPRRPWI